MDDNAELIERLLAAAGAIMEDASAVALMMNADAPLRERVETLARAGDEIAAIARAAATLLK